MWSRKSDTLQLEDHIVTKNNGCYQTNSQKQILMMTGHCTSQTAVTQKLMQLHASPARHRLKRFQSVHKPSPLMNQFSVTSIVETRRLHHSQHWLWVMLCLHSIDVKSCCALKLMVQSSASAQSIGVRPCRFPMTTVYTTPFFNGTCKWSNINALNLNQLPNDSCNVKKLNQTMHYQRQGSPAQSITNRSFQKVLVT